MANEITTGELFFRDEGECSDGRRRWMVCGIIATPPNVPIQGEHQYIVSGGALGGIVRELVDTLNGLGEPLGHYKLLLTVHLDQGVTDLTDGAPGLTPNDLLQDPIWRV